MKNQKKRTAKPSKGFAVLMGLTRHYRQTNLDGSQRKPLAIKDS